jgi:hypothetical protein
LRPDARLQKAFVLSIACAIAFSGCGKKQESAPENPEPKTELPVATTTTLSAPTTTTQPLVGDFDAALREVLRLESSGLFSQALMRCRKSRSHFRSHPRVSEFEEAQVRLQEAKREGIRLRIAVQNLGSGEVLTVQAALMELRSAGSTALILLRNAVRPGTGAVAVEAAKLLGAARDAGAIPFFVEVLQGEADPIVVSAATDVMSEIAELLQPDQLAACYEVMEADDAFGRVEVAGVLQAVFDDICGGDITNFNARVGTPGAYLKLRDRIERALVSDDERVSAWAALRGGSSVGVVNAFRGRYYYEQKFNEKRLVMDRFDPRLSVVHAHPPFPSNRQENVSIRWTADLDVKDEALYYFHLNGDDKASLWIDGKPVLTSTANSERSVSNRLSRGLHPLRVDFVNGPSAARAWLKWSGPGFSKQPLMPVYSSPRPGFVRELKDAIASLDTNDWKVARQAKIKIEMGATTAEILLRDAFMGGPPELAGEALELLVRRADERTPELLMKRLNANPDRATAMTWLRALRDLSPQIEPGEYPALLDRAVADADASMVPEAAALCGVLEKVFHGKKDDFNKHFVQVDGYEVLSAYVHRALASTDVDAIIRALAFGAPIAPYLNALESQGYLGEDFEEHSHDKRYTRISAPNYQLGFKDGRYLDVSVRWSGGLQIAKAGTYIFECWSDGLSKFWIDGALIESRRGYGERKREAELDAGFHTLKYEVRQGTGNSRVDLYWNGEGFERQHVGTNVLRSPLWPAEADRLIAALTDLGSTNGIAGEKCWARFKTFEPASAALMIHALRTSTGNRFAETARYLADGDDARAVPILLARLRAQASEIEREAQTQTLIEFVDRIEAAEFPKLYASFNSGPQMSAEAAILCAALVRVCAGKEAEFNKLTGDAGAYAKLKAHVEGALQDKDRGIIARACVYGQPFAPMEKGIYGRYYHGRQRGRLLGEVRHTSINPGNHSHPGVKRQNDIAGIWTGFLNVEKAGAYKFYLQTDMPTVLTLDNKSVVKSRSYTEQTGDITLTAGTHAMRMSFEHVTGNNRLILNWSGPDLQKRNLGGKDLLTQTWFKDLGYLTNHVANVSSLNKSTRSRAETAIKTYGDVAQPFLAHAVRYHGDSNSVAVAGMLLRTANPAFGALVAERIGSAPSTNTAPAFARSLTVNTNGIDTAVLTSLHASLQKDNDFKLRWLLPYFEKILVGECKTDPAEFGKRIGVATAYQDLQAYITRGLKSGNTVVVHWMLSNVGVAYPKQGLRGQYFAGTEKEKPYTERFDSNIHFSPTGYAFPASGTESNFWARWTGYIRPPQPGQYVFKYNGDGKTVKLLIDEKPVPFATQGTVMLKGGANAFQIELSGLGTNAAPVLTWSGPGMPSQVVTNSAFRVIPED